MCRRMFVRTRAVLNVAACEEAEGSRERRWTRGGLTHGEDVDGSAFR